MAQGAPRGKRDGGLLRGQLPRRAGRSRRPPSPANARPGAGGAGSRAARLPRMKIYTRTGDDGTTGLLGPGRVPKSAPRVEAYGAVDELNAVLGTLGALPGAQAYAAELGAIQSALFDVGAELATVVNASGTESPPRVSPTAIQTLEAWIDRFETDLPALRNFILPGGSALAAQFHLARTVCRRAERRVVALAGAEAVPADVVRYLNRLADLLFVMARHANHRAGIADVEWRPGSR